MSHTLLLLEVISHPPWFFRNVSSSPVPQALGKFLESYGGCDIISPKTSPTSLLMIHSHFFFLPFAWLWSNNSGSLLKYKNLQTLISSCKSGVLFQSAFTLVGSEGLLSCLLASAYRGELHSVRQIDRSELDHRSCLLLWCYPFDV